MKSEDTFLIVGNMYAVALLRDSPGALSLLGLLYCLCFFAVLVYKLVLEWKNR